MRSAQSQSEASRQKPASKRACMPYAIAGTKRRKRMTPAWPKPSRVSFAACIGMLARSKPARMIPDSRNAINNGGSFADSQAPSCQSEMWMMGKPLPTLCLTPRSLATSSGARSSRPPPSASRRRLLPAKTRSPFQALGQHVANPHISYPRRNMPHPEW